MHGPTHAVTRNVGKVQGLSEDALTGEGAIAVNQQREKLFASALTSAFLFGTRASNRDRIHGFKMARIGHQVNMDFRAAASHILASGAHVIFHIAAA